MKILHLLVPAAASMSAPAAAQEESRTYLLSLSIPFAQGERTDGFALWSWGVDYLAICRIPTGWRILAGRSATPEGRFGGEATHGVTWKSDMSEFQGLALVRLHGPLQEKDIPRRTATASSPPPSPAPFASPIAVT